MELLGYTHMHDQDRKNISLNQKSLAMYFESDLKIWGATSSPWVTSFEYWWIKKELLRLNENHCMNCKMMKKQEIYLEAIQFLNSAPRYRERFDLKSYRILCKNCMQNPHIFIDYDVRLREINIKFTQLPPFFTFIDSCVEPISEADFSKWQMEIKSDLKISEIFDWAELKKEYIWAKIISHNCHYLIGKAARKDSFYRRNTKYSAYLSLLKMPSQKLNWHGTYTDRTFHKIFGLSDNPIRKYLVERFGGISNTSKVYAATKAEFEQNPFMGEW